MLSGFVPPHADYPLHATCLQLTERLRLTRETAKAAIQSVHESSRDDAEASDG